LQSTEGIASRIPLKPCTAIKRTGHGVERGQTQGTIRRIIAAVAVGAGEGAEALRTAGLDIELECYTVEVVLDPTDPAPATSVRVEFGRADRYRS